MSQPSAKPRKCAVCGKPQAADFRPFCSKHCSDVDLAHWLGGRYAIAAIEPPDGEFAAPNDDEPG